MFTFIYIRYDILHQYSETATGQPSSLFEHALDQYLAQLKAEGKTDDLFVAHCSEYKASKDVTSIARDIAAKFEHRWSDTKVPKSRRVLQGFVNIQKTFDEIATTMSKDGISIC